MRKFDKILYCTILSIIISFSMVSAETDSTIVDYYGQLEVDSTKIINKNGKPISLHGMSLFWSQWAGQFYNQGVVSWLRNDWKCTVVRASMGINGGQNDYLAHPSREKQKIINVIEAAIDLGIYVIVDWHDHNAHNHTSEAANFFKELAKKYGDEPNIIYEIYNEPEQVSWKNDVKPYAQTVIDTIRKYDSDNIIIVGTPRWAQDVDIASQNPLDYNNIAYTLHFYAASHKQKYRDKAKTALNNGIALWVTEWGSTEYTGDGTIDTTSANKWLEFLDKHDISWSNWSIHYKDETSAALKSGASETGGWSLNDLKKTGKYVRRKIRDNSKIDEGPPWKLNINKEGKGHVEITPDTNAFSNNQEVELRAIPDSGYIFEGWTGNIISGVDTNKSISIQITEDSWLTAKFNQDITREPWLGQPLNITDTIQAEYYDKGQEGEAYHDTDEADKGEGSFRDTGVDTEKCTDKGGGYNIGYINEGEWLEYTIQVDETDTYSFLARLASTESSGKFHIKIDGTKITESISVQNTGGWQSWITQKVETETIEKGQHVLRLYIEKGLFNINWFIFSNTTGIEQDEVNNNQYDLEQNYPNPFNSTTNIKFGIKKTGQVSLNLYNLKGQKVKTLISKRMNKGQHNYKVDMSGLPSGVYFYRIKAGNYTKCKKLIFLK